MIGLLRTGRAGTVKRDQPEVRSARSVLENRPVAARAAKLHHRAEAERCPESSNSALELRSGFGAEMAKSIETFTRSGA